MTDVAGPVTAPAASADGGSWGGGEGWLRDLVQRSRDGIVIVDEQARVVEWNHAEEEMTGVSREDALGRPLWEVQHRLAPADTRSREHLDLRRAKILKGLEEGLGLMRQLEDEIERPDGGRRVIESRLFAVPAGNGFLACGICRDVTAGRRAERLLREAKAALERQVALWQAELDRRTRELAAVAAQATEAEGRVRTRIASVLHGDVQQDLAAARYHVAALRAPGPCEQVRQQTIDRIEDLLGRTMQTTRSLSHAMSSTVLEGNDIGRAVRLLASQMREDHGLKVLVHVTGEVKVGSRAVALFLLRAASELLLNVVKHSGVAAARIRLRRVGRYVALAVADLGRGLAPHELEDPGGIGLRSIRERARQLGGRMSMTHGRTPGAALLIAVPDVDDELD